VCACIALLIKFIGFFVFLAGGPTRPGEANQRKSKTMKPGDKPGSMIKGGMGMGMDNLDDDDDDDDVSHNRICRHSQI